MSLTSMNGTYLWRLNRCGVFSVIFFANYFYWSFLFPLPSFLPFVDRSGGVRRHLLCRHSALCPGANSDHRSRGCLRSGAGFRLRSAMGLCGGSDRSDGGLYHRLLPRTVSRSAIHTYLVHIWTKQTIHTIHKLNFKHIILKKWYKNKYVRDLLSLMRYIVKGTRVG